MRLARFPKNSLVLACTGFSLAGCDTFLDDDADADAFLQLRTETICDMNARCCSQEVIEAKSSIGPAIETCYEGRPRILERALNSGDVRVDLKQAQLCFDIVRKMSCDEWATVLATGTIPDECDSIYQGQPAGEACDTYAQCTSQFCDMTSPLYPGNGGIDGICGELFDLDEPCYVGPTCKAGLSCRGLFDDGLPHCVAEIADGETCSPDVPCHSGVCLNSTCAATCWGAPTVPGLLGQ